jgi:urocanate hydratase
MRQKVFRWKTTGKTADFRDWRRGGAQPLAATMAGYTFLGVDVDPERIKKRLLTKYIDKMVTTYAEAKQIILQAVEQGKAMSVGLVGNIGDVLEEMQHDGLIPDVLTDQTSAHDPLNGYVPAGITLEKALILRKEDPAAYRQKSLQSMARHVGFMLKMKKQGSVVFDYGNNLREFARQGEPHVFDYQGFVPGFICPLRRQPVPRVACRVNRRTSS